MGADLYKYFRIEAAELVEKLGQESLDLDKVASPELIARLFRYAHTLKGAARVVKQLEIARAANDIEELLTPHRAGSALVPRPAVDAMLRQIDAIAEQLQRIDAAQGQASPKPEVVPPRGAPAPAEATPAARLAVAPAPAPEPRTLRAETEDVDAVVDGVGAALAEVSSLRALFSSFEHVRQLAELCLRQLAPPRRAEPRLNAAALASARAMTEEFSNDCRRLESQFAAALERTRRELEQARVGAEQLRLTPAGVMFAALARAARDAAHELDKAVRFETRGGDTRLDGHVLERVQEALFHVVRNAVAHGIEARSERFARGKPPEAMIQLSVERRGRRVVFACQDDGGGLNVEGVRRALIAKGMTPAELAPLSEAQIAQLLLRARVSTAGAVSAIAGRGVGLDVLSDAADRLGGEARLRSRPGEGLRVELEVPLTIAAVETVRVESDGLVAALPIDAVLQTVRLRSEDVARSASGQSVFHEGKVIPFLPLRRALRRPAAPLGRGALSALIVNSSRGVLALGVDRVVGTKLVVLRKLPESLPACRLLAGASLDALGNPELVLDPDGLQHEADALSGERATGPRARLPILVIDDSLTTRMLEQSILESAGYAVELAVSAEDGLEKLRRDPYGLILVDIEMPGMDGFTFVETKQRDPALASIPAVLVSSLDAPEALARGRSVGASGYIVKGRFDQRELLGLIRRLLGEA